MNRMRKYLTVLILSGGAGVFAQGYPVLDVSNLYQNIESVYQQYQEIQHTIEQVQNTYKQIEQAATQMMSMDWNKMKNLGKNFDKVGENPFEMITAVHDSAKDITKQVNINMNKINAVQEALERKSISFGGMKCSMADLCGAGQPDKDLLDFIQNAGSYTEKRAQSMADAWAGKLSYKERRRIARHFGLSPKNYATTAIVEKQLSDLLVKSNERATADGIAARLEESENFANALNTMIQNMEPGDMFAQAQLSATGISHCIRMFGNLQASVERTSGIISQHYTSQMAKEQMENREKQKKEDREVSGNGKAIDFDSDI